MRFSSRTITEHPRMLLVAVCALSVLLGFSLAANFYNNGSNAAIAAAPSGAVPADWRVAFEEVAQKLGPSVVFITSERNVPVSSMPNLGDLFGFGTPRSTPQPDVQTRKASGSGVIVRADGYILTNNHVVAGADRVTVKLSDGREFKGKVFLDPVTDLALVKIEANNLPSVGFADSDKVRVGQWSMAIGNPFGLQNTVTVGVVSALRKTVDPENPLPYAEVIQTDASINPGNSGGPLVDMEGRIIGINGAIYSTSGGNVGIGFAIPANTAKYVMSQLIEKGKVVRGYLGVSMQDLTPTMGDALGTRTGALVTDVTAGSAAEKGGVKVKDVIVRVDNKDVGSAADLRHAVETISPGTQIKVVVVRDKKEKTLTIKLDERPGVDGEEEQSAGVDSSGISVQPLTEELAKQLSVPEGVEGVVVRRVNPGSPGARAGLRQGDVIMEIGDMPVNSVASFDKAVKSLKKGEIAIVVVQRGERSAILEMQME